MVSVVVNNFAPGQIYELIDNDGKHSFAHGFVFTTRRSSMSFCAGPVPETFRCYVCGGDSPAGHDVRTGNPSVCAEHCGDHEYERGEIGCMKCGAERPFDDEPDYDHSY